MEIARDMLKLPLEERRISLSEFHSADEVFTTGTMGEITPVVMIDGRSIGLSCFAGGPSEAAGPITARVQLEYRNLTETLGTHLPF